jgi:hypothetical protein
MDSPIRKETEKVQPAISNSSMLHGFQQHRMREEFAILDHQVDTSNIHVNDPAGANIEMANFAVAHLSFRQTYIWTTRVNQRVGIFPQQTVVRWLSSQGNRVRLGFGTISPAVENDKNQRFRTRQNALLN